MSNPLEPPPSVLARYGPVVERLLWTPVSGGFSGASVWRGDHAGESRFALKVWPTGTTSQRLGEIHTWMAQAAHLPFVPGVVATTDGSTVVAAAGRIWDATRWMSGVPREPASGADVETACEAVAQLHGAWPPTTRGPCPGVLNRLRVLADWMATPAPQPRAAPTLLDRANAAVRRHAPAAARALLPWADSDLPLRPCVRDLRGEHVLFSGDAVTGIVDYGAMAIDHQAVDLARILGDIASDETGSTSGLLAYRRAGGQLDVPDTLVMALDCSGAVCSVIGWLVRLVVERRTYSDMAAVAARLTRLVARVENCGHV